ncbi:hypothetical protein RF11_14081 [Thelohanellus kitauei]|uniref:GED domain-containing protein n=1 Tax=Thelohanellus kitauei TaxID=669202 RepID=A0A0C2IIJ5_THEKT|nr:hypothetical protein RF11_14081 [Thelohanellus kitauei]
MAYDSEVHKNMECVFMMVDIYLHITIMSLHDIIAKVIINSMIHKTKKHLLSHLLQTVVDLPSLQEMMQPSEEILLERQRLCAMNRSCEDALETIESFEEKHPCSLEQRASLSKISKPANSTDQSGTTLPPTDVPLNKPSEVVPPKPISTGNAKENPPPIPSRPKTAPEPTKDQKPVPKPKDPPAKSSKPGKSLFYS